MLYDKLEGVGLRRLREKRCDASNQYQIFRCTTEHHPTGRFSYKYNDHYNWCMKYGSISNASDEEDGAHDRNSTPASSATPRIASRR